MRIWKENAYQFFQVTDENLVLQKFLYKTVINADFPGRLARICIEVSFSKYFQSGIGLPAGLY